MNKPGCFGHVTTYNPASVICADCTWAEDCKQSALDRAVLIKTIHDYPDIESLIPAHTEKPVETGYKTKAVTGEVKRGIMTKKARSYYETLNRKGIDLRTALTGKFNPIDSTPKFLRIAFENVIEGGYKKRDLKNQFKSELGWGEATAASHVGIATSLFSALGLVTVDGNEVTSIK